MDQSIVGSNSAVLFASFLILVSYVYNKVLQPRSKSSDEKFHEQYILQEHHPHQAHRPQYESRGRVGNQVSSNMVQEPQDDSLFQDEPLSPGPDGWPSRDHDMALSDKLSAINTSMNMKGPSLSLNNSFFDQTNPRTFGLDREDGVQYRADEMAVDGYNQGNYKGKSELKSPRQYYTPNFPKANNLNSPASGGQKFVAQKKPKQSNFRRGPVYQDSSDTDTEIREPAITKKGNRSPRMGNLRDGSLQEMNIEATKADRKIHSISNERRNKNNVDDSIYEPDVMKKRPKNQNQFNDIELEESSKGITAQEIFDFSSKGSSKKKGQSDSSGKNSKDQRFLKGTRDSEGPTYSSTMDEDVASKKLKSGKNRLNEHNGGIRSLLEDSNGESKLRTNASLKRELLKRGSSSDLSYLTKFGSNLSLKKYVAKKIVQEQAFIHSDPNVPESKSMASGNLFYSNNAPAKQPESQSQEKPDLFKTVSQGSGLNLFNKADFSNSKSATPSESKVSSQEVSSIEKKEVPSSQSQSSQSQLSQVETKPSGLFANLNSVQNKAPEAAPKDQPNTSNTQSPPQKSLFNSSGLFGPSNEKTSTTAPTNAPTNNQSAPSTNNEAASKPLLFRPPENQNTSSSGLFSPASSNTTSQLFGPQKVEPKEQNNNAQQLQPEKKSLFANISAPVSENKSDNQAPPEKKPESKPGLFSQFSNVQPNSNVDTKEPAQQPSSLFSTMRTDAPQTKPPPPPRTDDSKTSAPSANNPSPFSGLFGPNKTNNSPEKPAGNNPGMNSNNGQKDTAQGLFSAFNSQSTSQPAATANSDAKNSGSWMNQNTNANNKPSEATSFLSAIKQQTESSNQETQPKPGGMFATLFQPPSGSSNTNTGSMSSSLFGPKSPSKPAETETKTNSSFPAGNNTTGDIPKPSGLFSSLFNANNTGETKAPSTLFANLSNGNNAGNNTGNNSGNTGGGGLFANLVNNNNSSGQAGSTGLFGNIIQSGGSGGLFGNK